jgi:phosphohistidine phosphatase SixA
MRIFYFTLLIIISFATLTKANEKDQTINILQKGGNLIFIRHAYAPGGGDPENFNVNNCDTQRNLNDDGRKQSVKIGNFFLSNEIPIGKVLSSNWCRCKETAKLAFKNYKTVNFLNSFFSSKFAHNRQQQMKDLKYYIKNWDGNKNLVLVTHYVVITEALGYAPSSGEIVVSDKKFNKIGSIKINY